MEKKKGIRLTDSQRLNWLRLIRSENVGAVTFMELIRHFGTAENALNALPELIAEGRTGKKIRIASQKDAEKECEYAEKMGIHFVCIGEPDYPTMLYKTENPPPVVTIKGHCTIFEKSSIGIVGSRNASATGKKITEIFAQNLGDMGFAIISGLARGIDTTAHQASVKTGTIAVVAGGADVIYPYENEKLYHDIIYHGGAIISEMPLGFQPRAVDFPRRNRIIASLSLGLLVVEAAKRSGSLITARLAAEIGRMVFAIPGSPLDPRAGGTNGLIREGATLVTSAKELAEAISPLSSPYQLSSQPIQQLSFLEQDFTLLRQEQAPIIQEDIKLDKQSEDKNKAAVLEALSTSPIDIETLSYHSGVPLQKIYLILIELELAGQLIRHHGGYISLNPSYFVDLH